MLKMQEGDLSKKKISPKIPIKSLFIKKNL